MPSTSTQEETRPTFEGYTYEELEPKAKTRALQDFGDWSSGSDDTDYTELIVEHARQLGFEVRTGKRENRSYIISYSIGDRGEHVSLYGSLDVSAIGRIMNEDPKIAADSEWIEAQEYDWYAKAFDLVVVTNTGYGKASYVEISDNYENYEVEDYGDLGLSSRESLMAEKAHERVSDVFKTLVRNIEQRCLKRATEEYEYRTSDESYIEEIESRDQRFHVDGRRFEEDCNYCYSDGTSCSYNEPEQLMA